MEILLICLLFLNTMGFILPFWRYYKTKKCIPQRKFKPILHRCSIYQTNSFPKSSRAERKAFSAIVLAGQRPTWKRPVLSNLPKRVATPFQQRGFLSCIVVLPSQTHCWHSVILLSPLLSMVKERNPLQKSFLLKLLSTPRKPRPKHWNVFIVT